MTTEEKNAVEKMIQQHADQLGEHFQSVQIMVTGHLGSEDNSFSYECGCGNFYARLGQVTEWLSIQEEYQRIHARRKDSEET